MVDIEVVYDESFGVWLSPNIANLRHPVPLYDIEIPANICISEFWKPHWLLNTYPYVTFWPKSVSFTRPIFARLDISDKTLPVVPISHIFHSLPDDMIMSWQHLEYAPWLDTPILHSGTPIDSRDMVFRPSINNDH